MPGPHDHARPDRPGPSTVVRTKIVATIGPACRDEQAIRGLVEAGVDVFRLNMAHASMAEHQETLERIRRVSEATQRPIGVLADLARPKIRLGELPGGAAECVEGGVREVHPRGDEHRARRFTTNYAPLIDELAVGDSVMLTDGTVEPGRRRAERRVGAGAASSRGHRAQPPGSEPAWREALRGSDERRRLAACGVGGRDGRRLREPVVRAVARSK